FTIYVDDAIFKSRAFLGMSTHGIQYLDVDTRTIPDGNHRIRIVANGGRGVLGQDEVDVTIRNGMPGDLDTVPPLVQFRNLQDGDLVSGKITIDLLTEDNT